RDLHPRDGGDRGFSGDRWRQLSAALVAGFVAFPILLLAGLLTSHLPGAWLLDGLELRLVNPTRGEVVRPAEWFELTLGPVGAVAILAGFVTLLHTSVFSYESALLLLGLWAVRICPA